MNEYEKTAITNSVCITTLNLGILRHRIGNRKKIKDAVNEIDTLIQKLAEFNAELLGSLGVTEEELADSMETMADEILFPEETYSEYIDRMLAKSLEGLKNEDN